LPGRMAPPDRCDQTRYLPCRAPFSQPLLSESAFAGLVDRAQWPLYSFVRGMIADDQTARDLVQDVFCAAWHAAQRLAAPFTEDGDEEEMRRWLFHAGYWARDLSAAQAPAATLDSARYGERARRAAPISAAPRPQPPDPRKASGRGVLIGCYAVVKRMSTRPSLISSPSLIGVGVLGASFCRLTKVKLVLFWSSIRYWLPCT